MAISTLHVSFLLLSIICYAKGQTCTPREEQTSKCKCRYRDENGDIQRTFDFKPLARKDGKPAFPYTAVPGDNYLYAYNPCYPFTDHCENVAACQLAHLDETYFYNIGDPYEPSYSLAPNGDVVITYTSETRTSIVNFQCNETALTEAIYIPKGENPASVYKFTIGTCLACYEDIPGCYPGPTTTAATTTVKPPTTTNNVTTATAKITLPTTATPEAGGAKLALGEILSIVLICLIVPFIAVTTAFMVYQLWRRRSKPDDTRQIMYDVHT